MCEGEQRVPNLRLDCVWTVHRELDILVDDRRGGASPVRLGDKFGGGQLQYSGSMGVVRLVTEDLAQQVRGRSPLLGHECGHRLVEEPVCQRLTHRRYQLLAVERDGVDLDRVPADQRGQGGRNSFARGIRASSTRIGITRIFRVSAVSISSRTKSAGLSSRR